MRKFWTKVKAVLSGLDTLDARKSVASDLRKASAALFALFLASLPGAYHRFAVALATMLGVKETDLVVSTGTAVGLFALAFVFRVVAFLLECTYKDPSKPAPPPPKTKKSKSRTAKPNEADQE
ncbi:hypothetical protein D3C71_21200 [compost metagenome]